MDYEALRANYRPTDLSSTAPKKKEVGLLKKILAESAPIVGGTLGAIGGSFVAPVAGTAAGGALGAGLGSAIKQNLLGEEFDLGEVAQEAAFGALPGAGKLLKGGLGAAKAVAKGENIAQGFKSAAPATSGVVRASDLNKVTRGASDLDIKQSGLQVGQKVRGKTVTPNISDEMYDFARIGSKKYVDTGVRSGKPVNQARDAQRVFDAVIKEKGRLLDTIDRSLVRSEKNAVAENVLQRVAQNVGVTGTDKTAAKFVKKISQARSVKELEAIRMEADDLAYTAQGAGKTSAAAQAREVREAIDEFVSPLSPEYKAVKGDYRTARDVLDLTSAASNKAKGVTLFGQDFGAQAISGGKSKGADVIRSLTGGGGSKIDTDSLSYAFRPSNLLKQGAAQTGAQVVGDAVFNEPASAETLVSEPTMPPTATGSEALPPESTELGTPSVWQDPARVEQAYNKALRAGDKQAAAAIIEGYKTFGAGSVAPIKKTEAQRARDEAAQLTQKALGQLSAGNVQTGMIAAPLENIKGAFNMGDQPTLDFNVTVDSLKAAIAKARAGTSFTPNEEALLNRYAPTAGDSRQQLTTKLTNLMQVYEQAAKREYGTQYSEPTPAAELGI